MLGQAPLMLLHIRLSGLKMFDTLIGLILSSPGPSGIICFASTLAVACRRWGARRFARLI